METPTPTTEATASDLQPCAAHGCAETFAPSRKGQVYCSDRCGRREGTRRWRERTRAAKPVYEKTCAQCGEAFETRNQRTRFCSPDHAKSFHNAQMVERRREQKQNAAPPPSDPFEKPATERKQPVILECQECEQAFERGRSHQVYCSVQCRITANRRRQTERENAAKHSSHPLAARYAVTSNPQPPVACLELFRERFAWPYSLTSRRRIAERAAAMLNIDVESVERQLARITSNSSDPDYVAVRYIRHDLADALLIAARGDYWALPAFPQSALTAREQVEVWCDIKEEDLSEDERVTLAHKLLRFSQGFLGLTEQTEALAA